MADLTKMNLKCKICALFKRAPAVWRELHQRVLIEMNSKLGTLDWLNSHLDKINSDPDLKPYEIFKPFTGENIYAHFSKHIQSFTQVEALMTAEKLFNPEGPHQVLQAAPLYGGASMAEYLRLESLISAVGLQLEDYEKDIARRREGKPGPNGKLPEPVSLDELKTFQKLITSQMTLKKDLAALQVKQEVAGNALREAVEKVVEVTMTALQDAMIDLQVNLQQQFGSQELTTQLTRAIAYKIGEPLKAAIPSILDETCKKYKIK